MRRELDEHDPEWTSEFVDLRVVADDGPVDGEPLLDLLVGHEGREICDEDLGGRGRAGGVIVVLQTSKQPCVHETTNSKEDRRGNAYLVLDLMKLGPIRS